jgi:thioredoxin-dependent peroxiredoxin
MTITAGKLAPDFTLDGSDGSRHSLKDYRGKTVILYFYPRDQTPGCTKEACGFRDAGKVLAGLDAVVLGVSPDSLASHERFIRAFRLPFVLLSDPERTVMKKYGAWGRKLMYGREVEGVIRSTCVIGSDGRVVRHWPRVAKAEAHPADVVAFLRGA